MGSHAVMPMNLVCIVLSERRMSQNTTDYTTPLKCNIQYRYMLHARKQIIDYLGLGLEGWWETGRECQGLIWPLLKLKKMF